MCAKPIVDSLVVEVLDLSDSTVTDYRCVVCAAKAVARLPKAEIRTRSAVSGKPVTITKRKSEWQVSPKSATFLLLTERDGECLEVHKAFVNEKEFKDYLAGRRELASEKPKPQRIDDLKKKVAPNK